MTRLALLLVLAPLSACATAVKPITIAQALSALQSQLQEAGAINPNGASPAQFAKSVRTAQCQAASADPEVPILAHDITIDLTGSFTANGGFAVGPAITGGPPFGVSASLTRAQTQGLTLPLSFAALSSLPDVMASQRLALLLDLPMSEKAAGTRGVLAERDVLRRRIRMLIHGFNPARCQAGAPPAGPFQPMTTRRGS